MNGCLDAFWNTIDFFLCLKSHGKEETHFIFRQIFLSLTDRFRQDDVLMGGV